MYALVHAKITTKEEICKPQMADLLQGAVNELVRKSLEHR
jgi:hypothetical protein